jgi:hypothetical protein
MGARPLLLLAATSTACAVMLSIGASKGTSSTPAPLAFPSAQTIPASGALPPGGARAVKLNAAIGEYESAWIVVPGGAEVTMSFDRQSIAPLDVSLAWGHFVRVGSRLVADALLPWDGSARASEQANQPVFVRVAVPRGTAPGTYTAELTIGSGTATATMPLSIRVFPFEMPDPAGGGRVMLTSFHVSAPTYLATVSRLYGFSSQVERRTAHARLYQFLAEYFVSPSSWGFGEPRSPSGYQSHTKWWLDSATNMRDAARSPFPAMRVPVSSNRTSPANRIAGLNPTEPEGWCAYLRAVRAFWDRQGRTTRSVPYL